MFFNSRFRAVLETALPRKGAARQRCRKRQYHQPEALEQRCLLAASTLTPSEQLMLELMNRARANPTAEATRLSTGLNQGLAAGTITTDAKQPLAPQNLLAAAADGHTADMRARGFFRHTSPSPNSTTFDQRVTNAGYTFTVVAENLAVQAYLSLNQTTVVTQMHDGLYRSPSHRVNMMNNDLFEASPGIDFGTWRDNDNVLGGGAGATHSVGMTTVVFGSRTERPFITGVVYTDASDGSATDDSFYSIGEAAGGGGTVTATNTSTGATYTETIGTAGGYSLQVPAGTYNVTVNGGGLAERYGQNGVVVGTQNVKVDFETTTASIAQTILAAPVITTVHNTKTANQQFTLDWSTVSGANRYEVTYTSVATGQASFVNELVASNSFVPSTPLPIGRYNIWVRVNGTDGATSPWSTPITVHVNPAVTLNSLTANQTTQRPTIAWSALSGAARYEVWGTNVTSQQARAFNDTNVTGTSFTPSSDLDMGVYRVWVRAYDASGQAASWSASEVFHIGPQLISPVIPTFRTTPQFSWTSVSGTASYQLYVQRGSTVVINESNITGTAYTPTSALASGNYRWWVRPFTASGRGGAWSSLGEFNVDSRPVVLTPTGTTNNGAPDITWTNVEGAASYEVYLFNDDTPGLVIRQKGLTAASFTSPALADGNYRVWVRSFQADGTALAWSRAASFVVDAATTTLPVTLIAPLTPTLDTTPEFRWAAVAGAASYDIYLHNGATAMTQTGITGTSYTPSTALGNGEWQWWVRAVTTGGAVGAWSTPGTTDVSGRPVLAGPTGSANGVTPTFSWTLVEGASRYILQVDNLTTGTTRVIREDNLATNSYTPTAPLTSGNYRFWVQAIGSTAGSRSPWSFSIDFSVAEAKHDTADHQILLTSLQLSPGDIVVSNENSNNENSNNETSSDTVENPPARREAAIAKAAPGRREAPVADSDVDNWMHSMMTSGQWIENPISPTPAS